METAEQGARDWSAVSEGCTLLTAALPGVEPRAALRRMLVLLDLHRLQLHLAQVDTVDDPEGDGFVTLLRTVVQPEAGRPPLQTADWAELRRDACRLKWSTTRPSPRRALGAPSCPHRRARARAERPALSVVDRPLLSRVGVRDRLMNRPAERAAAVALAELSSPASTRPARSRSAFLARLGPRPRRGRRRGAATTRRRCSRRWRRRCAARCARTSSSSDGGRSPCASTPAFFAPVLRGCRRRRPRLNTPYGVFFVAGRHFNGYHVRFADTRAAARVVLPPSHDTYAAETRRHFNETFRLAQAQQLKNKDIPGAAPRRCASYPVAGRGASG